MVGELVIGIDLGGTAIKLGCFDAGGTGWQRTTIATPQPPDPDQVVEAIASGIATIDPQAQGKAIGIGTPGPTDAAGRIAHIPINLARWRDVPLADLLEQRVGLPTVVENDANCAGLGEAWLGAGRNLKHFILLTLGTGVGGAIILNGELFTGHYGAAAELGLITLNPDGPPCNSGNCGSLEQYVSRRGILRRTGREPEILGQLARAGDSMALQFWREYGKDLGAGLASLVYVLTPEAILIGGGISASAEFFLPSVQAELESRVVPNSRVGLKLLPAILGNQAGMIGAARLAWQMIHR